MGPHPSAVGGPPPELASALRDGPFPLALQAAITAKGLSLEAVQRRLRAGGHQISVASLSYWQRGRSRPERPSSLAAVDELERLLDVPAGGLTALLGSSRPRGRWVNHVPGSVPFVALGHSSRTVRMITGRIDTECNRKLETLAHDERMRLAPDGRGYHIDVRKVVRARTGGADRLALLTCADYPGAPPARFTAVQGCALGGVVHDRQEDTTASEVLFGRPLAEGETYVLAYRLVAATPDRRTTTLEKGFRQPTRHCVLEVAFDPAAVPVRCTPVWQPRTRQPSPFGTELTIEPCGTAHLALFDVPAGRYGLRWEWA